MLTDVTIARNKCKIVYPPFFRWACHKSVKWQNVHVQQVTRGMHLLTKNSKQQLCYWNKNSQKHSRKLSNQYVIHKTCFNNFYSQSLCGKSCNFERFTGYLYKYFDVLIFKGVRVAKDKNHLLPNFVIYKLLCEVRRIKSTGNLDTLQSISYYFDEKFSYFDLQCCIFFHILVWRFRKFDLYPWICK